MSNSIIPFSDIQNFKTQLSELNSSGEERCGVILEDGSIVEKQNRAQDPFQQFEFAEEDLEGAIATWHTHSTGSANLSLPDYWFFMSWEEMVHFIISSGEVRCYLRHENNLLAINEAYDLPARPLEGTIS